LYLEQQSNRAGKRQTTSAVHSVILHSKSKTNTSIDSRAAVSINFVTAFHHLTMYAIAYRNGQTS